MTVGRDRIHALYVDEEPDFAEPTATFLEREDDRFAVEHACSAEEAFAYLEEQPVDCIVSDYDIPGLDGIEFLEAVRERRPAVPFILYTRKGSEEVASDAISAGVTDYLQKEAATTQYAVLANRVANAVKQYRGRSEEERKTPGRELDAAQRRFDAMFNNPTAFMALLGTDGTVIDVNETALEFVGRELEDVRGEPFWDTPWWDHSEALQAELRAWIDRAAGGELVRYESKHYSSDGEQATFDGVLHPIRDADGSVVSLVVAGRDISDRKVREEAIDALHGATRELIGAGSAERIAELIADTAADLLGLAYTGIHFYDEEAESLEPVASTDVLTDTIGEPPSLGRESLAWEAFDAGETRVYDDLEDNGGAHNPDTPMRSELIVPLGRHGVVIAGAEEPDAFNRSDQRLVEVLCGNATAALDRLTREELLRSRERDLERKNERLEEFTSVVSHDLRSPLNVAMGRLDLAQEESESEHLDAVERAHDRMQALINDLLTLASEEEQVTDREAVSLPTVARGSWDNVETGGATLVTATDRTVQANESRLKQLFGNLFRNAVEHGSTSSRPEADDSVEHGPTGSQTGSGDSVEHSSEDEPAGLTVTVGDLEDGFYVEDDGPGIPEDARESVLEAGYSTSEDGTGFGLRIVEQVAEAHGWDLRVTEGSDGGARFEVTNVGGGEE